MHFDLVTPCPNCPFRRTGGCRLTRTRAREIGTMMLSSQGGTFTCHKTAHGLGHTGIEQHCAGALIFAESQNRSTQAMQLAERLGIYRPKRLMDPKRVKVQRLVFSSIDEFIAAQNCKIPQSSTGAST